MLEPTLYWLMRGYNALLSRLTPRKPRTSPDGPTIVLTGTFHSTNWISAHINPMVDCGRFQRIVMVTSSDVQFPAGVEVRPVPGWLRRLFSEAGGRLLYFSVTVFRENADAVGGFHLLFNGLIANALARLSHRRSIYFCVGGPAEIADGGLLSENKLFARLPQASPRIEQQLKTAIGFSDAVVCMGSSAAEFMQEQTRAPLVVVNPGAVVQGKLTQEDKQYDLIFLGRLAPIKNIPVILQSIAALRSADKDVTLAIVGDGELRQSLQHEAQTLGIEDLVTFTGQQKDTAAWLARSRIFILSSISEGLSLSLMEALAASLPAIVPRVGDLPDLVKDNYNGHLLDDSTPAAIAAAVLDLLDTERYESVRRAALQSAAYVSPQRAAARWAHTAQHLGWTECVA